MCMAVITDDPPIKVARTCPSGFLRCSLDTLDAWETLPLDKPLQSLALVSCGHFLYRIGGLGLAEEDNSEAPLCSSSDFTRFDPQTKQWTAFPPLPSGRSSHDAIAADGKIYVVGGWNIHGTQVKDWHDTALVFDTNLGAETRWESLPIPAFRRRDLAVTTWQDCIWAIGGKDDHDVIERTVYYYDPHRGYWSEGPELPSRVEGLQGYGVAACGLDSGLYVSGADGVLYRLSSIYGVGSGGRTAGAAVLPSLAAGRQDDIAGDCRLQRLFRPNELSRTDPGLHSALSSALADKRVLTRFEGLETK